MEKILITGGAGFIGSSLNQLLLKKGYIVETISQNKKNITTYNFTYTYKNFINHLKDNKYDVIFFLSGNPYPQFSENKNLLDLELTNIPLLNLLEAIKDTKSNSALWFSSSVAVYGKTINTLQSEKDICYPLSKYAVSKLMGEEHVKYYSRVYNLNVGSFRIFSTFGPQLKRQVVYDIYKKLIKNPNKIKLLGTGYEGRDLCFVENQVERMYFIAKNVNPNGDIFNIGSGKLSTIKEIANHMIDILNTQTIIEFIDKKRTFDGIQWIADVSKIKKIGYEEEEFIYDGLKKTIFELENSS